MPDRPPSRSTAVRVGWLAGAFALVAAMLAGPLAGAVGGLLAQPLFALATATHPRTSRAHVAASLAWWMTVAGVVAGCIWPAVDWARASGSLTSALVLSGVVGIAAIAAWRVWPAFVEIARTAPSLRDTVDAVRDGDWTAWRGLGVALAVVVIGAALGAIAAGLVPTAWTLPAAGALALGSLLLHGAIARVTPAALFEHDAGPLEDADAGIDADAPHGRLDPDLDAQLYAAARAGRVERALELIEHGADPHAPPDPADRDKRSLPVLAAVLPDLRLLRALIAQGVDVNAAHAGMTPLLAATRDSWHGRPDAVMTLLANGADPRLADRDGNTPLHFAARSADPGVAALLRDAAAELDAINSDGLTPLGVACASGNWRLAKFLLELGARTDAEGARPALLAAAGGDDDDPAGVALLLRLKAKVDARNGDGRSALHEAAFAGHDQIVQALLAANADPGAVDARGRTPLHEAARGANPVVVERLLAHPVRGAVIDATLLDADARHALLHAAMAERASPELVMRLVALGLDPEQRDVDGKRALDHAAEAGRWSVVAVLDPERVPASARERETDLDGAPAALHDRPPSVLLREALDANGDGPGADELEALVALLSPRERGGLLHDDEAAASPARVRWLLAHGADPDVRNAAGDTPLHAWLDRGANAAAAVQALLAAGVSPAGAGGLARFLAASNVSPHAARTLEPLALQLLDHGADPFAPSGAGDPPLALAVRLGWQQVATRLLDIGVDLDARDSHGMSALHLAAALGREPALRALIRRGATPDLLAADGQTPLGVALSSGRRDLADWLDWRGWRLPHRPLREEDVPAAAIVGDVDAVRRLLDLGLTADATDHQGCTALLRAAGGGHRAVVDLLLARGADPQLAAHSGATPLSAAVSMRHVDIVDRLIHADASIEQRLPGDLTVLMVACALGLPDMSARLLAAGADVHAVDGQGRTALHCAAMYGFGARERNRLVALFDTLLLSGAESGISTAAAGATPLLLLLGARAEPGSAADEEVLCAGLTRLTDHGAALDAQDARGFGPLHLAALHGLLHVVKWLLDAGADPDLRDTLNRPPREIAVMRGFVDIAAEFAPTPAPGGPVSMARLLRDKS